MLRYVALLLALLITKHALGGGPCSGVKGGCGRSAARTSYAGSYSTFNESAGSVGTVSVRGYRRKDGTYVRAHRRTRADGTVLNNLSYVERSDSGTGAGESWDDEASARRATPHRTSIYRKHARKSARSRVWGGTGSAYTDRADPVLYAPPPEETLSPAEREPGNPASASFELAEHEFRTWTAANGKYTLEAAFVSYSQGRVTLRKSDSTLLAVEYDQLSVSDRNWIERRRLR
jgi:hypothetical protein